MKKLYGLFIRYLIILSLGLFNFYIIHSIFYPATFFVSSFLLSIFGEVNSFYSIGVFLFNRNSIELIGACIASSAYYFLFILTFSTADLKPKKRLHLLLFVLASFFTLNVFRIILMSVVAGSVYFNPLHVFFWYIISTIMVISIWFFGVKLFKIKSIPVYSDIKYLLKEIKNSKRN